MAQIHVGCSGWNYKSWRGPFYPLELPVKEWLRYYAARFDTVEVNNTFYRLPEASTFAAWRAQTPACFRMAVKASRFLTHMKRLRDPDEPLDRLFSRAASLGPGLGPVLYQLPGQFQADLGRLETFLAALPRRLGSTRLDHVMEFRHPSWYSPEAFALLGRFGVGLCHHDKMGSEVFEPVVSGIVYMRFHGPSGQYWGRYTDAALARWADRLAGYGRDGCRVYAYFNNDPEAAAPANALTLREMLEERLAGERRIADAS